MKQSSDDFLNFPMSKEEIEKLDEKDIDRLVYLDQHGLLVGNNEDISSYKKRLVEIESDIQELKQELDEKGQVEIFNKIFAKKNEFINTNILSETSESTKKTYKFSINWVPGFFLSKGLGMLAGGCAVTAENGLTLFLIRSVFSNRKKWLWYSRNELLSHELCHVAREPLQDRRLEEFFAYNLSTSSFRKYFGNCFQSPFDTLLLLFPLFLLLLAQTINTFTLYDIPMWCFWLIALTYPAFLLARNQFYRNYYFKAQKSLVKTYDNDIPFEPILFRCHSEEVKQIGEFANSPAKLKNWIKDKAKNELRWKVINKRFIS